MASAIRFEHCQAVNGIGIWLNNEYMDLNKSYNDTCYKLFLFSVEEVIFAI